jgi:hypothetical protein
MSAFMGACLGRNLRGRNLSGPVPVIQGHADNLSYSLRPKGMIVADSRRLGLGCVAVNASRFSSNPLSPTTFSHIRLEILMQALSGFGAHCRTWSICHCNPRNRPCLEMGADSMTPSIINRRASSKASGSSFASCAQKSNGNSVVEFCMAPDLDDVASILGDQAMQREDLKGKSLRQATESKSARSIRLGNRRGVGDSGNPLDRGRHRTRSEARQRPRVPY